MSFPVQPRLIHQVVRIVNGAHKEFSTVMALAQGWLYLCDDFLSLANSALPSLDLQIICHFSCCCTCQSQCTPRLLHQGFGATSVYFFCRRYYSTLRKTPPEKE